MTQLFVNNGFSTLAAGITNSATSITVATGDGAKFPSPSGGDTATLTISQAGSETSWENVILTARSGDVLTVTRGAEGSTAAAWSTGDKIELRITSAFLNNAGTKGIPLTSKSANSTFALGDAGGGFLHPSADTTARTYTIDANATVPFPLNTPLTIVNQNGAGVITIAITTDTMRLAGAGTTGSRTLAANGIATAVKLTSTEWIISGIGLT